MQLSPHFSDKEYGVVGASAQVIANARQHSNILMEPIRAKFGPVNCHDGCRPPADNAACGGAKDSQHLYLGENSALDFDALPNPYQAVFDWIRLESGLPFDQVILEFHPGTQEPRCVHISYDGALTTQRREAMTGDTNGTSAYTHVAVGPVQQGVAP